EVFDLEASRHRMAAEGSTSARASERRVCKGVRPEGEGRARQVPEEAGRGGPLRGVRACVTSVPQSFRDSEVPPEGIGHDFARRRARARSLAGGDAREMKAELATIPLRLVEPHPRHAIRFEYRVKALAELLRATADENTPN